MMPAKLIMLMSFNSFLTGKDELSRSFSFGIKSKASISFRMVKTAYSAFKAGSWLIFQDGWYCTNPLEWKVMYKCLMELLFRENLFFLVSILVNGTFTLNYSQNQDDFQKTTAVIAHAANCVSLSKIVSILPDRAESLQSWESRPCLLYPFWSVGDGVSK